eukprot:gnl/Hemi2/3088_TR1092_c0_g1_i1.p1 gnl/Hemi2/3088_TR1092_c0_g1~~gnl/Hemi2/3088_TR1092_c0_g1_i1.p1  ORF type:complete len:753 (+),score=198.78 gnl/Hemi2/3088_TR1092_c0_g1_i1:44-2260(+)
MAAFAELGVLPELIKAVEELDWQLPKPVQQEAIPLILGGGDVSVAAETGSGKTGAFALPVLQIVHETIRSTGLHGGRPATATAAAAGPGAKISSPVRLDMNHRDSLFAVSEDGLTCQARSEAAWAGGRATVGVNRGKYYYEARVCDDGLVRVGWSTASASFDVGTDRQSWGFGGTGKKSHGRQFEDYGEPFFKGDVVGVMLDCDAHTIAFSREGVVFPTAFQNVLNGTLFPAVCVKNAEVSFNFGSTAFKFPVPAGYAGLQDALAEHATLLDQESAAPNVDISKKPICIVMEPSKELALQTHQAMSVMGKYLCDPVVTHQLFVGGQDVREAKRAIQAGVNVVVATPGRLQELVSSGALDLSCVRFFVLDEADALLTQSGSDNILLQVYSALPKNIRVQVLLFSATLHSEEIKRLSERIQKHPTWVDLKGRDYVPDTIDNTVCYVDPTSGQWAWGDVKGTLTTDGVHQRDNMRQTNSPEYLSETVKRMKPQMLLKIINTHQMEQALIFVRTRVDANNLHTFLTTAGGGREFRGALQTGKENEYSCVVLHGDRSLEERRAAYESFKEGHVRFMISTDVAARGLDIQGLAYVINLTLPDKEEDYIHRIGRVGRADRMGLAISLVATVKEKVWYHSNCPSRGKNCANTNLLEHGGCCIWYDEPGYLKAIEARIQTTLPSLTTDQKYTNPFGQNIVYGQKREDTTGPSPHLLALQPAVRELASMELDLQQRFIAMQTQFILKR